MEAAQIRACLADLSRELGRQALRGEICLYGGAVMCLVFRARPATKDVDAIFKPAAEIRAAAAAVAERHGLGQHWLNDAVKGFLVEHPRRTFLDLPALQVFVPEPEYMLAMKALAARFDTADRADVKFLIQHLGLRQPAEVFAILRKYYPHERIKPATQFFIEELFQDDHGG
jgi:hypothetical protein